MYKVFEIKTDDENRRHKNARIRYDSSEISENRINENLESVNNGELGENSHWLKADGVGELFELMGLDQFMKYLCSKDLSDLDSIIKDNQSKDQITELVDENTWTPTKLKEDLKEEISNWVYSSDSLGDYDIHEELNQLLNEYDGKFWHIEGSNMGWRKRSGEKFAKIEDGQDFISKILPNTECSFFITKNEDNTLTMVNYHHDSPMGENYTLTLMTAQVILEMYKDKNNKHELSEMLDNSHSSRFKPEERMKLFNQALVFDKSEDISTLLYNECGPDDEAQAVESLVLGANSNASSALSQYVREASLFNNEDRKNNIIAQALSKVTTQEAKNILTELKED